MHACIGAERLKKILAKEVMLTPVYTKGKDDLIKDVIDMMKEEKVRSIVVVDKTGKPLGILFRHEIMEYIAKKGEKYDDIVKKDKIGEVMKFTKSDWNEGVVRDNFLPVYPDMALATIKTNLETRKLYYAIVLGAKGEAIGILSRLEILKEAFIAE